MILLTYGDTADGAIGVNTDEGVLDLAAAAAWAGWPTRPTARNVIGDGLAGVPRIADLVTRTRLRPDLHLDEDQLRLHPAVLHPPKIVCVGLNYRRHAVEAGQAAPPFPIVFSKPPSTLAGHRQPVRLALVAKEYDYEVELAVVIGARARDIPEEWALDIVLGYATATDSSARDLQRRTSQWFLGKAFDGALPLGPYLVAADEVADPQRLRLRTWMNGILRQDGNTSDMIFGVGHLIHYLSSHMTLEPGDVVLTGTPDGVIAGASDPVWLRPGDEVSVEVSGLGRLDSPLEGTDQMIESACVTLRSRSKAASPIRCRSLNARRRPRGGES